jgi:hypothetical protein
MPWPAPPPGSEANAEFLKVAFQAEIDLELARAKSVHDARLGVAQASIERGRSGAEFVRNAAAAIVTLYTGILGVAFATGSGNTPLPARGLAPAVFLGLAVTFASAYVALISNVPSARAPAPHSNLEVFQERRLQVFMFWVVRIALGRVYFLHASVLTLGLGVLFLPAPFVAVANWVVYVAGGILLLAGLLVPVVTTRRARQ